MDIQKREGYTQEYQWEKVVDAVTKALEETNELATEPWVNDILEVSKTIEQLVFADIDSCDDLITVEDIQDFIEDELMEMGLKETARAFIKYRDARSLKRRKGWEMDDLQYSIWDKKYRFENETFDDWLDRVSGGNPKLSKLIRQKKFLFAGRILAHRGLQYHGKKVTYSNCYVMTPPEDNLESIFDSAKELARTYSYGGGCGISIGNLRPKGAEVNNSARFTTGATSFMQLYDLTTGLIGQNGRRGALMISIPDSHPDLVDFMDIKTKDDSITKANISIQMSHEFMVAVMDDKPWKLHWEGEDGKVIEEYVSARDIFRKNAENNWDWAEAGVLYWDTIKDRHLMSEHPEHEFAGVNPCAEEPLMANGSCLLGSLNLSEFVVHPFTDDAYFDYTKFEDAVHISVEGLNEVLDEGLELHPLQGQRDNARDWRQIGLKTA